MQNFVVSEVMYLLMHFYALECWLAWNLVAACHKGNVVGNGKDRSRINAEIRLEKTTIFKLDAHKNCNPVIYKFAQNCIKLCCLKIVRFSLIECSQKICRSLTPVSMRMMVT